MSRPETIFALSSGRPPAAIAVVRVSGPQAGAAAEAVIGRIPKARQAAFATLRDPANREPLDQAVVLWFPGPASETGEDVVEFQLHGGRAVIAATLGVLGRLPGLRPAEAGEFTRRALANGRLDLTAVEGLADLIGAETEAQRRQAVRHAAGALGRQVEVWRGRLIEALALVEAGLDFPDESDVPADLVTPALKIAATLRDEVVAALAHANHGERLREGLRIAVAGPPNAGKSTLFNWLAGRDAAIVSPYPGTTRDVLEVNLDLQGYPVTVVDTAGLRESFDPVEQEGIRRARERAELADLVLWVDDVRAPDARTGAALPGGAAVWRVFNKSDLVTADAVQALGLGLDAAASRVHVVSALTGAGMQALLAELATFASEAFHGSESSLVSRARHRNELETVVQCLNELMNSCSQYADDLVAEHLRVAAQALGRLAGRVDVEDVLDVIFRDFCIGK